MEAVAMRLLARTKVVNGATYGRLTPIGHPFYVAMDRHSKPYVVCQCECGQIKAIRTTLLLGGHTSSCGCLHREACVNRLTKHGDSKTHLYGVWCTMRQRCKNPAVNCWHRYGGRGIVVCEEWSDFVAFKDWAEATGYKSGLTLERKDGDKPYCPGNCVWETRLVQAKNTSRNRVIKAFGESKILSDWFRDSRRVVSVFCVKQRLKKGMSLEEAISTPSRWVKK